MTRRRWGVTSFLFPAVLLAALPAGLRAQDEAAPVVVSEVVEREVSGGQTFVGTVKPLKTSVIGSAVDGRVVEYFVEEGDAVKENQPIARLLTATLEIELAAAKAELKLRQEQLAELENGSRPEEIARAKARMQAAEALRKYSQAKYERMQSLFRQEKAVTQDELQEARSLADRDEQSYLEAKADYELAVEGPRKEQIAQAAAQVQMQSEQVRLIEDRITKHTLKAPFDGYVTVQHSEVGAWVSQGDPLAEVILLKDVEVEAFVPGEHAVHLARGMSVRVDVPALDEEVFTGTISQVVPQADVRSRTFPVKVRIKNEIHPAGPLLKGGMLARAILPAGSRKKMPLVHKDALVLGGEKPQVFVVDLNSEGATAGTVRPVPVELGVADGLLIQVNGKLSAGDLVVVRGNERLQPGQAVAVTEMLSTEVSQAGE